MELFTDMEHTFWVNKTIMKCVNVLSSLEEDYSFLTTFLWWGAAGNYGRPWTFTADEVGSGTRRKKEVDGGLWTFPTTII